MFLSIMAKQQSSVWLVLLIVTAVSVIFFASDPSNLTSLIDFLSQPSGNVQGCKALPFVAIFIIEAVIVFVLLSRRK